MTSANAFGRLFPPALFLILGAILSAVWLPDPLLLALGACGAAASAAWLIVATLDVARASYGPRASSACSSAISTNA